MNHGKSPGLDGIPPELYLKFWDELSPIILEMFQQAIKSGCFNRDINTAIITLLHKRGKDSTLCSSFRPLSLLNADIKLYAKVLPRRLETVLPILVHPDQTGFVKQRYASDNMRRLLHIVDTCSNISSHCAVLSVDADKAFDRLEWKFLWHTLETMGFGDNFIGMLKTLYHNPTAVVITSTQCSKPFSIERGARQGCPVSALLFTLSLEPLVQKIRNSHEVKPIATCGTYHKTSLYADDLLLFLNDVLSSLPAILKIFHNFSLISGHKINLNKSSLLPLNTAMINLHLDVGILVVTHFKYLGIDIYSSLEKIISKNYKRLKKLISDELNRWSAFSIPLSTRISVVKSYILPKVNFYANMLHLSPPAGFWENIQGLAFKFIWQNQHPRISRSTLQKSRTSGGLSVPNFEMYFASFVLRSVSRWFDENYDTPWVNIENHIVSPYTLKDVLFSGLSPKFCLKKFWSVIAHSISVWNNIAKTVKWDIKWHSDTPIFRNKLLLIGGEPIIFPPWQNRGIHNLSDIYNEDGLRSFHELRQIHNLPGTSFFFYLQLRTALRTYGVPWNQTLLTHPLQHFLNIVKVKKGFVSRIYNELQGRLAGPAGNVLVWNIDIKDLGISINWQRVWSNIPLTSRNHNHQLIHYKLIQRYYLSPRRCCQIRITQSPLCQLCPHKVLGTYLHMMWECPGVFSLWLSISNILSCLIQTNIPCLPHILLLNDDTSLHLNFYRKRVLFAGLTAAKKMLIKRWKPPHVLNLSLWKVSLHEVLLLEISSARAQMAKTEAIQNLEAAADKVKALF